MAEITTHELQELEREIALWAKRNEAVTKLGTMIAKAGSLQQLVDEALAAEAASQARRAEAEAQLAAVQKNITKQGGELRRRDEEAQAAIAKLVDEAETKAAKIVESAKASAAVIESTARAQVEAQLAGAHEEVAKAQATALEKKNEAAATVENLATSKAELAQVTAKLAAAREAVRVALT